MEYTGFNAMGKPVPTNRRIKAQTMVKEILPQATSEEVFSIVGKMSQFIKSDNTQAIVGEVGILDEDLKKIDLTGRYMLLATMLTD